MASAAAVTGGSVHRGLYRLPLSSSTLLRAFTPRSTRKLEWRHHSYAAARCAANVAVSTQDVAPAISGNLLLSSQFEILRLSQI